MNDVYILSAKRTPIGKFGKSFAALTAPELGSEAVKGAIKASRVVQSDIEEVIMGNVLQAGVGQNPAGQVATLSGLPSEVTKYTVNVVCASGMLAVEHAFREIALGEKNLIVAGGMESMSHSPLMVPSEVRWGPKQLLNKKLEFMDSMLTDGLLDAFYHEHMGISAERSANKFGITRKEADEYAFRSFDLARRNTENRFYSDEIIPVNEVKTDEGIRETSFEDLQKLKPAFGGNGVLTAGNSSQLSDGSSALVIASEKYVNDNNLKPLVKITGFESTSLAPRDFVETPVPCTKKLLSRTGKKIDYYDVIEHNEAFSVASIIVQRQLGIEIDRFNIRGGAIAIGHPLGNSGSRILVTMINSMIKDKLKTGLATICHGGGGAHTMTLEAVR
ncbi:acetyl-CoA C-acetyltransferase [Oxyplasma meridianum]|uniref:Acetyl-CoA C-acetyltransferase n=1 Tax=Oxyplasma meridianum TaxID=3073602 RepID=A0AAX4NGH5_9ARCH